MTQLPETPMGANTPSADCLYVYGIVDAVTDALLPVRGPGGATLQQTAVGPLAAVHCWIDPSELDDLEADIAEGSRLAALVRHHDEVVRALAAIGPVLPVRLGTLLPDQAALTELLGAGDAGIGTALDRVRDCGEWELRVNMSGAVADESADEQPEAVGVGAGTNYLMRRQNERRRQTQLRETLDAKVAALDAELAQLATAATGAGMSYAGSGARRAYLVHESARNAVVAVAAQGIAELESAGCDAALRGPLPPYSFADVRLEAHADA